ncbi:hypothetical protein [Pedobacter montanisoli]|uniref:Uncharacterized protein n=1 Tax=Pedobacter montanisoli TaxID=2923277 RepID=A0ABS9ZTC8_9SPHI|nr:hypothetical protein [Pedobacter montanisoli]MCJ0741845.1 hypothetical protein [Pedobacter montanisoli]
MKEVYIAVSSNSRELYKADVYRILAKPENAIEHFRYQDQWIGDLDSKTRGKLIGKEVILVFKHLQNGKTLEYIPIRKGEIIDFEYNTETEIYHYYFKLGKFCDLTNLAKIQFNDNIFFFKTKAISKDEIWRKIIEKISLAFTNHFFYKIEGVTDNKGRNIALNTDKSNHSYYYTLRHGNSYTLNLIVANKNESKNTLTIESSSNDVSIIITDNYFISVPFDKLRIPITTKSLDSFEERSFFSFYIKNEKNEEIKEYENHIHVLKKMKKYKPALFGVLSSLLIASTWLLKDKTASIENLFCWKCGFDFFASLYILSILTCSGILYALFNKK